MKPYPFQQEAIETITDFNGRALLSFEMGLGKTPTSLWWAGDHGGLPLIVVCPATLKWMWEREIERLLKIKPCVLDGQKPIPWKRKPKAVVINYDILRFWLPQLKSLDPQTLILDEIHMASSRSAQRTKATKQLSLGVPNVIGLSGTPLTNRPSELWQVLNILRPDMWPAFFPYAQRYCCPRKKPWGWEYKGASNLPELNDTLINNVMIRRTKAEVLHQLPPLQRSVIPLSIRKPAEYRRAESDFLSWLSTKKPSRLRSAQKAEELVKLGELKRLAARLKLKGCLEWVDQFFQESEPEEKLVLFAVHRKMIEALKRRIPQKSVVVDGSTSQHMRKLAVDQFQKDRTTRVFIGNIQAAGVGLTLTRSKTVAFTELDWRPAMHTQAEARVHRITQEEKAMIYYLIARGTIEEKLASVIQQKQSTLSAVLDGGEQEGDLDVYSLLMEQLAG